MIEWSELPELNRPVLVTAFEGWNDAGEAATDAIDHLRMMWDAHPFTEIDPEDYYDFQVTRPHVSIEDDQREITWPTTRFFLARLPERDVILAHGIEPNMRWRRFCEEITGLIADADVQLVINLGALLADAPHTRSVPLTAFSGHPDVVGQFALDESRYEGPTGIVGVLQSMCDTAQVPCVSLWAAVPHYVSSAPCPKATLAILSRVEDMLDVPIPLDDLPDQAAAWQRGVEELAEEDPEIREYVQQLERSRDTDDLSDASGEAIAAEFERYLKRRSQS